MISFQKIGYVLLTGALLVSFGLILTAPGQSLAAEPESVGLELIGEGFAAPVGLALPGDDSGRLFIVDQAGQIRIISADGEVLPEPFLDLQDRMVQLNERYDERGLLGLAFHPNFASNQRFFVYYSAPLRSGAPDSWNHTSHVSEFTVSTENPNEADADSEQVLLQIDQPQSNHNGGPITFGPDGYLYIPLGDGGRANDVGVGHPPLGNGQDVSTLLGSILRIDVDGEEPYAIPPDNPFVDSDDARPEIFAYGFRNPFRITFDAGGDQALFAGDVGQNLWEEVDLVTIGNNYGWNIREGAHCFDPETPGQPPEQCPETGPLDNPLIDPIMEYRNANAPGGLGLAVIGGFVYRGSALSSFTGHYVFGDWSTSFRRADGALLLASPPAQEEEMWPITELEIAGREDGRLNAFLLAFGQDNEQELYILTSERAGPGGQTGKVFKLVPSQP